MKTVTSTIGQMTILTVLALVVGLGANAVRGKDHINLFRQYFKPLPEGPGPTPTQQDDDGSTDVPDNGDNGSARDGGEYGERGSQPSGPPREEPFQTVSLEEVIEIFKHPKTEAHAYVFVDARSDEPYAEGHIPRALQCDYYRLEQDLEPVLPFVQGAEKVIVYCNGGDCEDSLYLCSEFLNAVPWNNIYLFKGGWEAWEASGMPIEPARDEE